MANDSDFLKTSLKLKEVTLREKIIINDEEPDSTLERNITDVQIHSMPHSDMCIEGPNNSNEFTFDQVIGYLEDMLIDEDFHRLQNSFLEKHWQEFDSSEENKHSYMAIFKEYTSQIEDFISKYLKERIANFDMENFAIELEERKNTLEGEIFEVLLTFSDFTAFKEILLDYRANELREFIRFQKNGNKNFNKKCKVDITK